MFNIIAVAIVVLDGWGMIGIWTDQFGFQNLWEFWVRSSSSARIPFYCTHTHTDSCAPEQLYQVYYGFLVCPWYSYSQIMISEVTPRGHEFLFFSLFSIVGKASSFIGPLVSSAIIDASASHNNSIPFYFLFSLSLASCVVLVLFVDLKKSQVEQEKFLEDKARHLREKLKGSSPELA